MESIDVFISLAFIAAFCWTVSELNNLALSSYRLEDAHKRLERATRSLEEILGSEYEITPPRDTSLREPCQLGDPKARRFIQENDRALACESEDWRWRIGAKCVDRETAEHDEMLALRELEREARSRVILWRACCRAPLPRTLG